MKKQFLQLFFVLLIIFTPLSQGKENPNGMTTDRVEIYSVSTQINKTDFQPFGSVNGGTILYLKAFGHNRSPSKNSINVGPYNCIIQEAGISDDMIACKTTKAFDPLQRYNLTVELHVTGKVQSSCRTSNKCRFTYSDQYTPYLRSVVPNASTPNSYVNWNAIWRVEESEHITKLQIGQYNCNRFQLANVEEDATSNLNDNITIGLSHNFNDLPCQLSPNIPAGLYSVNAENLYGDFQKLPTSRLLTADGQKEYEFVVTAEVTSINQNEGGEAGNRITINGAGFSNDESNVQVSVGNIDCEVVSITNEKIVCDLQSGVTEAPAQGQFIKGQGLTLDVWQFDSSSDLEDYDPETVDNFKSHIEAGTIPTQRQKLNGATLGSWNYSQDPDYNRAGAWARGYFKAPRTGNYKFWVAGNDQIKVYLNTNNLDQTISENNLILERTSGTSKYVYNSPNQTNFKQENGQILTQGEFYWIEMYIFNSETPGFFTLSVETPPIISNQYAINSLDQIKEFKITPDFVPEEFTIKMYGTTDDPFSFQFLHYENRKKVLDKTTLSRKWNEWSSSFFRSQIDWVSGFHSTEILEENPLDSLGNYCTGSCTPSGVEFKIRFNLYRQYNPVPKCSSEANKCIVKKTQSQSAPVSGTYKMKIGTEPIEVWISSVGWSTDIPYDFNSSNIKNGLIKLNDDFMNVTGYQSGRSQDGYRIGFHFRTNVIDYKGDIPQFNFDTTNLKGGSNNAPTIEDSPFNVVSSSYNSLYEPVPFDMSFVSADAPQVSVIVNSIKSVCKNDCTYNTVNTNTPVITSFTETTGTVSIDLSTTTVALTDSNTKIWYGGSECTSVNTSNTSAVTCTVAAIEAGDNQPIVLVKVKGYASFSGSAKSTDVVVSSVSPNTGSTLGGIQATITGTGFPISDITAATVTFGSVEANIVSTSNTSIVVEVPQSQNGEQAENVQVALNGKSSNTDQQFTYDNTNAPTVSQLNPVSASPVKKQNIVITGSNFGTDYTKVQVFLVNTENQEKYELAVQQSGFTDTEFTARLGGGHNGDYKLQVILEGVGSSVPATPTANDFKYTITLDSVTPQTGNPNGGTYVTLTGTNFLNTLADNTVFLNQGGINLQCYIVSATTTEIVVRIPAQSTESQISDYTFIVQGRLIEESICTGDCSFQYQAQSGDLPMIDVIESRNYINGQELVITGSNFVVANGAKVEVNQIEYPATVDSTTQITFTIPTDLPIGVYNFLIYNGDSGFIGGFEGTIILSITGISPKVFSTFGTDITISGSGFDEDTRILINNVICPIISYTSTQIVCIAPPVLVEDFYQVILKQPSYDDVIFSGHVAYNDSKTPTIVQTNQTGTHTATYDLSDRITNFAPVQYFTKTQKAGQSITITLQEHTQITGNTIKVYLQSTVDPKVRIEADSLTNLSAVFNSPMAGSYFLKVWVDGLGYARPATNSDKAVWEYIFNLPSLNIASGATTSLIGSSTLTLSGSGFDTVNQNNNEIFVCGELCNVSSVTSSQLECEIPLINTKFMDETVIPVNQVLNPLYTEGVNKVKSITTSRDAVNDVSNKWDFTNEFHIINLSSDVVGQVEDKECWVKFESYDDSLIEFQSVQWYIEQDHASDRGEIGEEEFYYEFTVQGSNNGNDWSELANNKPYDLVNFKKGQHQHANYGYGGFNRNAPPTPYKYIRAKEVTTKDDRQNTCHYHSIHLYGKLVYATEVTTAQDLTCSVVAKVQGQSSELSSTITYSAADTAKVTSISPIYATILGGNELTITGTGYGTTQQDISVTIDGIACVVSNVIDTAITCTTSDNSSSTNYSSKVIVIVAGIPAIITNTVKFNIGLLYSDEANTWNGELAPRDGDSVYLSKGQTLIVDQSTNKLENVIIEGTLVFADNQAIEFFAHNIIIRQGKFIIGSIDSPYENDLTITLHGNYWNKQLPEFGNKVLGCHTCELQIHGQPKIPTWSSLKTTVNAEANEITIIDGNTNWQVGDKLAIATTDYGRSNFKNQKFYIKFQYLNKIFFKQIYFFQKLQINYKITKYYIFKFQIILFSLFILVFYNYLLYIYLHYQLICNIQNVKYIYKQLCYNQYFKLHFYLKFSKISYQYLKLYSLSFLFINKIN